MTSRGKSPAFSPKKNSNALKKLKSNISLVEYKSSSDDEDVSDQPTRKGTTASKNGATSTSAKPTQIIPSGDSTLNKSYLMFENNANVCWLDASMALLVHNRTLIESLDEAENSSTQIVTIIRYYYEAVSILNDYADDRHIDIRVKAAKDLLKTVQESALKYLQPILKYKEGEPDSAFCSLFNLITESKSVKDFFDVEFTWVQVCKKCDNHRIKKHRKPIVTLPRVAIFHPSSPIAIYQCPVCKEPDQNMILNFRTLPQCLLFHFESGAGKGELQCKDFELDGRTYRMTGVMTLEKGKESLVNHFITFIRDPTSDTWLECNDLNDEIMCFCMIPPFIELEDVYIVMYEAADKLGTLPNRSQVLDNCEFGEESVSGNADIPLIDLADDSEKDLPNEKGNKRCNEPKEGSKKSKNVGLFEYYEEDANMSFYKLFDPDSVSESASCLVSEENTQSVSEAVLNEVTTTQILKEKPLLDLPSQSYTNEIGVAPEKDSIHESVPANIIIRDLEEMKHSTEGTQATVFIDASAKDTNVGNQNTTATKKREVTKKILTSLDLTDIESKMSENSTLDQHINKTSKNLPNDTCTNTSQSFISNNGINLNNSNLNDQPSNKDLKATNESKIFMLNLDLCPNPEKEVTLQNKLDISSTDQLKNINSVSTKMNISPTRMKASTKLNDTLYDSIFGSPKSRGQMFTKKYQKLMHTLKNTDLKPVIPLQMYTENDPKSVAICEVPNSELSEFKQIITNKRTSSKESHINHPVEITTNSSRSKISETVTKFVSNQDQEKYKDSNSQSAHANIQKESDLDSFDAKEEQSTRVTTKNPRSAHANIKKQSDLGLFYAKEEQSTRVTTKNPRSAHANIKTESDLCSFEETEHLSSIAAKKQRPQKSNNNVNTKFSNVEVKELNIQINNIPSQLLVSQEYKGSHLQTNFKRASDLDLMDVKKKDLADSTVTTVTQQRLQKAVENVPSRSSEIAAKDLRSRQTNKTQAKTLLKQNKQKYKDPLTAPTNSEKESDVCLVEAKLEQSTSLSLGEVATKNQSLPKAPKNVNTKSSDTEVKELFNKVPSEPLLSQEYEGPDSQIANTKSQKESNMSLLNGKKKEPTNSVMEITMKLRLRKVPENVPTKPSAELASKDLRSQVNATKPLLRQVCKDFNSDLGSFERKEGESTEKTTKKQKLQIAPKNTHSEPATEVTAKVLRSNVWKTQSKQDKQEHKVFNSRTVLSDFEKESEPNLDKITEVDSANLTVTTSKRQRLQNTDSKSSAEIAVRCQRGKINKTQSELLLSHEIKELNSEIVHNNSEKESDKGKVDAEAKERTTLAASNMKRRRCKSDTSSPHKKEKQTSEQAVQPKRQYCHLITCQPESIAANTEKSIAVATEKPVASKSNVQAVQPKRQCRRLSVNEPESIAADTQKSIAVATEQPVASQSNVQVVQPKRQCHRLSTCEPESIAADTEKLVASKSNVQAVQPKRQCRRLNVCEPESIATNTKKSIAADTEQPVIINSVQAVQPKRQCRRLNVCEPESIAANTEKFVAADTEKPVASKSNVQAVQPKRQCRRLSVSEPELIAADTQKSIAVVTEKPVASKSNVQAVQPKRQCRRLSVSEPELIAADTQKSIAVATEKPVASKSNVQAVQPKRQCRRLNVCEPESIAANTEKSIAADTEQPVIINSVQAVQPKRQCRRLNVCEPESIAANTEKFVAADTEKPVASKSNVQAVQPKRQCRRLSVSEPELIAADTQKSIAVVTEKPVASKSNVQAVQPKRQCRRLSVSEPELIAADTQKSIAVATEKPVASKSNVQAVQPKRQCCRLSVSEPESIAADTQKSIAVATEQPVASKSNVQAVQPKRQCRRLSVSEPESIAADTEKIVVVDTDKTVAAERERRKRGANNLNSPEMLFSDLMEQSADAKNPRKTYCKRNLGAVCPKSPRHLKNKIKSQIVTDRKLGGNQSDKNIPKYSLNDCTVSELNELLPPNCNGQRKSPDPEVIGCNEGCDCDTLCVDETIDIVVDSVLHSMFNFFDIRKH